MDLPRAAATTGAGGGSPPAASHLSSPPYSPQAPAIGSSPGASRAQQQHRLNTVAPTTGQSLQHPLLPRIVTPTTAVATPAAPLEPAMDYGYFGNKESGGTNGGQMPLPPGSENPWSGAYTKTFMRGGSLCAGGDCGMAEAQRTSNNSDRPYSLLNKLSAEFVGTMLFVFVGSLSGVYANPQANSVIHAAFAHGLAIFVLIASFGHISGGHFNPAVTLGVALSGKLHAMATPLYWLAQLAGGFCAALLVRVVTNQTQYDSIAGGATIVPQAQHWQQALVTEALLTGFLVQTVLTCAVDTAQNVLAPLAIGMTVALDIFAGGPISGASMNPARSFGPCLAASIFLHKGPATRLTDPIWSFHFVYWAGPFLGAALAALLYRSLLGRGHNRLIP